MGVGKALSVYDVDPVKSEALVGAWGLRNACVTFYTWRNTPYRAEFISRDHVMAVIHSFSEYSFKYDRLGYVREERAEDAEVLRTCERRPLGLAFTMSSNNLYHQFFHAVAAFELLLSKVEPDAVFIPIATSKAGLWLPRTRNTSHAFEFTMRAFSTASAASLTANLQHLLNAPCTCFDRVEGATGGVNLYYPKHRDRILAFTRRALSVARATLPIAPLLHLEGQAARGGQSTARVLYARRASMRRVLANDQEVSEALSCGGGTRHVDGGSSSSNGRGVWLAECTALERMSLTHQMRTIAAANILVGVHGQAMVWMPFLLSEHGRAAVVEVQLPRQPGAKSVSNPNMYAHFALALRIHHIAVDGQLLPACLASKADILGCNMTVSADRVVAALKGAIAHVQQHEV